MHKLCFLAELLYQCHRIYGYFAQSKMVLYLIYRHPFDVVTLHISTYFVRTTTLLEPLLFCYVCKTCLKILWLSFRITGSATQR